MVSERRWNLFSDCDNRSAEQNSGHHACGDDSCNEMERVCDRRPDTDDGGLRAKTYASDLCVPSWNKSGTAIGSAWASDGIIRRPTMKLAVIDESQSPADRLTGPGMSKTPSAESDRPLIDESGGERHS